MSSVGDGYEGGKFGGGGAEDVSGEGGSEGGHVVMGVELIAMYNIPRYSSQFLKTAKIK